MMNQHVGFCQCPNPKERTEDGSAEKSLVKYTGGFCDKCHKVIEGSTSYSVGDALEIYVPHRFNCAESLSALRQINANNESILKDLKDSEVTVQDLKAKGQSDSATWNRYFAETKTKINVLKEQVRYAGGLKQVLGSAKNQNSRAYDLTRLERLEKQINALQEHVAATRQQSSKPAETEAEGMSQNKKRKLDTDTEAN